MKNRSVKALSQQLLSLILIGAGLSHGQLSLASPKLITSALETGCGISDEVYAVIGDKISVHSKMHFPLNSQGAETGRRLYGYEDQSWFLTLEFFGETAAKDVTCIVATGDVHTLESAMGFQVPNYPEWKWGEMPSNWPVR